MSANKKAKTEPVDEGEANQEQDDLAEQLGVIKEELYKLNEEASDKVLEIEQQFSKKRRPIYDQRNAVLKQIPQFWQTALLRHPMLSTSITEDDMQILGYCTELNVEDYDDIKSGYRIVLKFSENPYFSNEELVKSYSYQQGGHLKVGSTMPLWKEGYEPPEEEAEEEEEADGKRRRSPDYKLFTWFMMGEELVMSTSTDDIADIIKEEIWPDPMKYYEGELSEDAEFDDEGGEFEEEGEEGEEEQVDGEGEGEEGEGEGEEEEDAS